MSTRAAAPGGTRTAGDYWLRARQARIIFWFLFALHCSIRLGGLWWNIEHHSAFGTQRVPTYHIDELILVDGLRTDFRLFNYGSIHVDGPLSTNLLYLASVVSGNVPPDHWNAAHALWTGRALSAAAECLTFPLLWMLFKMLGVSPGLSLFGMALLVFSPNNVFNGHIARSHALANCLQVCTVLAAAKLLQARLILRRVMWLIPALLVPILAGAARYPLVSLGIFPLLVCLILIFRSIRRRDFSSLLLLPPAAALVVLGLLFGFDLKPIQILNEGVVVVQTAMRQIDWLDVGNLASSAGAKILSTLQFPGGLVRGLLLACAPLAIVIELRRRGFSLVAWMSLTMLAWAILYLLLWARFTVPWQRYSLPWTTFIGVLGLVGLDRVIRVIPLRVRASRWFRIALTGTAVCSLVPSALMAGLITDRFLRDTTHPLYRLSYEMRSRAGAASRPTVFMHAFWGWNLPVLTDLIPPSHFSLRLIPSFEAVCAEAKSNDLIIDLVWPTLEGTCPGKRFVTEFAASNLGPTGFPYPADASKEPWGARHYEDYHYLFQSVTLRAAR